ncbi:MAG: N-acetylgalactosamine-N,N'-diacetylbacillosaminyl-diphospho-undecaprenol 4-alpha-N-acetylgalactosaminyltransferase [Firmicutes bacterium ADurb.Bin182]|nr:MAG: N-acetylgalactosamine-N,N'-diacetylbacillosaminyl-diphospho-undecaprenol 4-alpha-N-acetylgalactosaminyltransferase [Firmicutes bacterium ADurb.Bin182]
MMKIALVAANMKSGGSERMMSRISFFLSANNEVDIVLFDSDEIAYEFAGNLVNLNAGVCKNKLARLFTIAKRIIKYNLLICKRKYDVIFAFASGANKIAAYSIGKAKVYLSCRGFGSLKNDCGKYHNMLKNKKNMILFNSYALQTYYESFYPEDITRTIVVQNAFDIEMIRSESVKPLPAEDKHFFETHEVLLSVSSFTDKKGQWNLLKAFELLKNDIPDAGLVFVGYRGDLESTIKDMASRSKYSGDILFVGFSDNPFKYMKAADVFVLPSVSEGFPNVVVEAMTCGVPIVATDCMTGPREILCESSEKAPDCLCDYYLADYGILTPVMPKKPNYEYSQTEDSHKIFARALKRLLTDDNLSDQYSKKAFERARAFDNSVMCKKYDTLITREGLN